MHRLIELLSVVSWPLFLVGPAIASPQLSSPAPVELLVQDTSGRPIEGAALIRANLRARLIVMAPGSAISLSDGDGRISISRPEGGFVVYKKNVGYAAVTDLEPGVPRTITLGLGLATRIRCRLRSDDEPPLAGVRVTLSRIAFENVRGAVSSEEWLPGLNHAIAVFSAVTNDDGLVEIRGLPPGDYVIQAWAEKHVCVDGISNRELFAVPHKPDVADLHFAELAGAAISLKNDMIIGMGDVKGFAASNVISTSFLHTYRNRLRKTYPKTSLLLGIRGEELLDVPVFSAHRGVFSFPVEPRPLPISGVLTIDNHHLPPMVPTGTLRVASYGNGARTLASGFALSTQPFEGSGLSLEFNAKYTLPVGRYIVGIDANTSIGEAPQTVVEITEGTQQDLRLEPPDGMAPFKVAVLPPWDGARSSGMLTLTAVGHRTLRMINWRGEPSVFWMNEGIVEIRFSCYGVWGAGKYELSRNPDELQTFVLKTGLQ